MLTISAVVFADECTTKIKILLSRADKHTVKNDRVTVASGLSLGSCLKHTSTCISLP